MMAKKPIRWAMQAAALMLFCLATMPARAADGWAFLLAPGTHALMRHAQAPGTGDPANFRLGDCATQRNLDDDGRAQARAAGAALRAKGVRFTHVLSGEWCRTKETARLLDLGPVEDEPQLNSFFTDRSTRARQSAAIVALLKSYPAQEKAILVTHQVNITALTGIVPRSGEITVVSIDPQGALEVVGRIDAQALR